MSEHENLATMQQRLAALELREQQRARFMRRASVAAAIAALLAVIANAGIGFAADGNCPNSYAFCFGAGSPALASQVNHNFDQIQEWLEQKVGPIGNSNVTTAGTLNVGGAATIGGATTVNNNLTVTGALSAGNGLTVTGNLSVSGQTFGCYTRWGEYGCGSGYTAVLNGHGGGFESHTTTAGVMYSNVECVSDSASVFESWPGNSYFTRLFRGAADRDGMEKISSRCSTCCRGGCYTAFGTTSCASGYTAQYFGRPGGIEAINGGRITAQTLCVDSGATALYTWGSGYTTRLMRFRDGGLSTDASDGMDSVTNTCAVCCR